VAFSEHTNLDVTTWSDLVANASPELLLASTATLLGLEADNSQNTDDSYLKLWNIATVPSVGSSVPDWVFRIKGGEKLLLQFDSDGTGVAMSTGVALACVTAGGTAGTTSPTNNVLVTLKTAA